MAHLPLVDFYKSTSLTHPGIIGIELHLQRRLQDKDSLMVCQGAQEETEGGQEDQGTSKQLGGTRNSFTVPWSSWPSFWLFLGSLTILQGIAILKPASHVFLPWAHSDW